MPRLLLAAIPLLVSAFIYWDIQKTGKHYLAILIASLSTFFFPIGPIVYVLFRRRLIPAVPVNTAFCPKCGASVSAYAKQCPKCGNTLKV